LFSFSLPPPPPPRSTLFPYTTLFRSISGRPSSAAGSARTSQPAALKGRDVGSAPAFTTTNVGICRDVCTSCDLIGKRAWLTRTRSEEHTSELQSRFDLVCRLLLEKKK